MRGKNIAFTIGLEYNTPEILVGAAIRLFSSSVLPFIDWQPTFFPLRTVQDAAKLSEIPGVQAIRPIVKLPAPQPVSSTIVEDPKAAGLPDSFSTHMMTGVDKVHAQGNFGKGIKIGMIDTGVDYNHPLLGGGFGPGFKVIGGYDFVGDAFNGEDNPSPDGDPLDECNGHGSHVAGIIGASPNNTWGISGVAYEASLASYRIFGCVGYTSDDIIAAALIRGYNEKMDVLTLSLGGPNGWTEGTASVVASRIAAEGRVVTVAAGNDGENGAWYTSAPGGGIFVISVASVDNIVSPVQNATVQGVAHDPIPYFSALPLNAIGALPIYVTSTNISQTDDACSPLPDSTPDLSPYLVVVHRGTCLFTEKLANIQAKGGKVVVIYNSDTGAFQSISIGGYKAVLIGADDGKFLVEQFIAGANITVSFPQDGGAFTIPNPAGGLVSAFSTIGPTFDMHLSPALAAPGGNILSTLPLKLGGYGLESGTSMSTPFAAGAAALILETLGTSPAAGKAVLRILQSTAAGVASTHADGAPLLTAAQQGAGLIQVDRAISMKTIVAPGQIALNDTARFKANHSISVTNMGNKTVTYRICHVPAGTIGTVAPDSGFVETVPTAIGATASVAFSESEITVHAGHTKTVHALFTPPAADNATLPVYSGFIHVVAPTETIKVTYLGVAASLKAVPVLDASNAYFGVPLPAIIDADGRPQVGPANYTFKNHELPFLLLAFGCAKMRIDLVDTDITLTPTVPSPERAPLSWSGMQNTGTFSKVKTIGLLGELDYQPRSTSDPFSGYSSFQFQGTFANGTRLDDGQYRVLLRALRVGGNPKKEEDYESWLGPQFGVVTPPL
ncbi:subtilisin-like protease [Mycena rosella]|uniref:Subtilisin-like protease n=1 Tax=Mycena rosella TaxID=1033263 RepID=A0AAD7DMU8_MYCRO|nr:subtilisin-like protease [Mycena rosella]